MLDLQSKGVPEADIVFMLYTDHGMDLYANAVIASRQVHRGAIPTRCRLQRGRDQARGWT